MERKISITLENLMVVALWNEEIPLENLGKEVRIIPGSEKDTNAVIRELTKRKIQYHIYDKLPVSEGRYYVFDLRKINVIH